MGATAAALAVYVATLAPGLTFAHHGTDGGDLIAAARTLGIPHPTGYPTYTMLAWLVSQVPIGTVACRVNLLSAMCAAGAVGLVCDCALWLLPRDKYTVLSAVGAALALAFSSLFWSQAVIAEVSALQAFIAALLTWLLVRWRSSGRRVFLWLVGLVMGLGLGNHLTLAFAVPPAILLLWPERRTWWRARTILPAAGLLLAGLSVYAYLPLAASRQPPVNWGNPSTWEGFVWVVTGAPYRNLAFGLDLEAIPGRLAVWLASMGGQFGWCGLGLALAGGWSWWQRDRPLALFGLRWIGLVSLWTFFYNTADSTVYLLAAAELIALGWALGARQVMEAANRWRRHGSVFGAMVGVVIALLPLGSLAMHWQKADLSRDMSVEATTQAVLAAVAPGGLVVVQDDRNTFPMWYTLYAEEQRPDVAVVNAPLLAYAWYRENVRHQDPDLVVPEPGDVCGSTDEMVRELIVRNLARRPIYATDPSDTWREWFDVVQEGDAPVSRIGLRVMWEPKQ